MNFAGTALHVTPHMWANPSWTNVPRHTTNFRSEHFHLAHPCFELCRSSSPYCTTHVSQPILNQPPKTHYKLQIRFFSSRTSLFWTLPEQPGTDYTTHVCQPWTNVPRIHHTTSDPKIFISHIPLLNFAGAARHITSRMWANPSWTNVPRHYKLQIRFFSSHTSLFWTLPEQLSISADPGLRQTCFVIALCYWGIQACRYQVSNVSNSYNPPNPSRHLPPPLQPSNCCMASSRQLPPSLQGCSLPFPGRQRSIIAACPLPAHSPLLLRHSSLPFASLQTPKTLKPSAAASTKPGRQPLLLQGCSLPFPGRQRSSIAACPLPAHSPLLLRHSSLPFASLQTPKTPKTLRGSFHQASRVAACPFLAVSVPSLQPALCLHIALSCYGIRACRLPAFKPLKPLKPSAAASTKQAPGRQRSSIPLPAHSPLVTAFEPAVCQPST